MGGGECEVFEEFEELEEFEEEEIMWSDSKEKKSLGPEVKISRSLSFSCDSSSSSLNNITKKKNEVSPRVKRSSSPVNIPDWSKIYGKTSSNHQSHSCGIHDDDDDDECMVPPHEIVARRLEKTKISSYSMCEGIGRTLKGRDLSKTRNAILTKTGFLE